MHLYAFRSYYIHSDKQFFFFLLSDAINFISSGSNIFNFKTSEKCLKIHFNYLKDQFNTIQSNSFIKQKGNAK